jgi:hypothetical protein
MSSLREVLIVRELGIGGAGVRAKPFRRARFRRTTGPLLEARPPSGHVLPNNLDPIKNKQIGAVDEAACADIVPCTINVSG